MRFILFSLFAATLLTACFLTPPSRSYNDQALNISTFGNGSLAAHIGNQAFATRQYLINKIGEIASSKNIAIKAGKEPLKGGNFELLDESSANGIMELKFKTL